MLGIAPKRHLAPPPIIDGVHQNASTESERAGRDGGGPKATLLALAALVAAGAALAAGHARDASAAHAADGRSAMALPSERRIT